VCERENVLNVHVCEYSEFVCVRVCVRERKRENVCMCVCVRVLSPFPPVCTYSIFLKIIVLFCTISSLFIGLFRKRDL